MMEPIKIPKYKPQKVLIKNVTKRDGKDIYSKDGD